MTLFLGTFLFHYYCIYIFSNALICDSEHKRPMSHWQKFAHSSSKLLKKHFVDISMQP